MKNEDTLETPLETLETLGHISKKVKIEETDKETEKEETDTLDKVAKGDNKGDEVGKFTLKLESGKNSVKKQIAKVLEKHGITAPLQYKNLKTVPKWTYCLIHFTSLESLLSAKILIDDAKITVRNKLWTCEQFHQKQRSGGGRPNFIQDDERSPEERIADQTTPLWKMSYQDQLNSKQKQVLKSLNKLKSELFKFFPKCLSNSLPPYDESTDTPLQYIKSLESSELRAQVQLNWLRQAAKKFNGSPCRLLEILPSPVINGYRSKCEFTFGRDLDGEKTCGMLLGLYKEGVHAVLNARSCLHVSPVAKSIANVLEEYVCASPYDVYDRIKKEGVYRIALVRTLLSGENMIMVQINPKGMTTEQVLQEKADFQKFILSRLGEEGVSVNSLFFQESSDLFNGLKEGTPTELLHGTPFITEHIMGQKFQISPSSFFQVNPKATEVLYSKIREITLQAAKNASEKAFDGEYVFVEKEDAICDENSNNPLNRDVAMGSEPGIVLLDLCCGTGTIGMTMAAHVKKVIGVELTADAIEDAKKNAALNGIKNVEYINAKVEDVMDEIFKKHISPGDTVIAVVDPPRAGVHNSVIKAIRSCHLLDHVIFVACALKSSMQNLVDLMRPTSNKLQGFPFIAQQAVAVDLFPHTEHVEVIMEFERQRAEQVLPFPKEETDFN